MEDVLPANRNEVEPGAMTVPANRNEVEPGAMTVLPFVQ